MEGTWVALGANDLTVEGSASSVLSSSSSSSSVEVLLVVVVGGAVVLLELVVEVVVAAGGVCETRDPSTSYAAAQAARSMPSGQHHVSPFLSEVQ